MINLVPETYSAPPAARRRYIWRSMTMFGLLMIAFTGFHAVGGGPPERFGLNLAMVLLCIGFVLAASFETVVLIRSLDELQQRIHILAWAIGLGAAVTVAFLLGLGVHMAACCHVRADLHRADCGDRLLPLAVPCQPPLPLEAFAKDISHALFPT